MDEFLHRGTKDINLIILGSPGVGKSAIMVRYLTKRFIGDYHPLLETVTSHQTVVDGKQLTVHVRDTAWQGIDSTERENYLVWADGILIVYSIIDRESFDTCRMLADKVLQLCDDSTPVTLMGNKNDMLHMRQVTFEEGAAFCRNRNLLFAEVSAGESYESVEGAITSLVREVRHAHKKSKEKVKDKPDSSHKHGIRQSLRNFTEKRLQLRHRTSTL